MPTVSFMRDSQKSSVPLVRRPETWSLIALMLFVLHHLGRFHALPELLSNFRLHLFVLSCGILVWATFSRVWRWVVAIGFLLLVEGPALAPMWLATPDPLVDRTEVIRVMQYNILSSNDNIDAIIEEVRSSNPDFVALQEVSVGQWEQLAPALLADYRHVLALQVNFDLDATATHGGKVLLSRQPLEEIEIGGFPQPPLAARTQLGGREVVVVALHPPSSRFSSSAIEKRARKLDAVTGLVSRLDIPVIILADLNAAPASTLYRQFVQDLGWHDPRHRAGGGPTYPGGAFNPFGIAIDHIFVSPEVALHGYTRGGAGGSDHRSLLATISLFPEA